MGNQILVQPTADGSPAAVATYTKAVYGLNADGTVGERLDHTLDGIQAEKANEDTAMVYRIITTAEKNAPYSKSYISPEGPSEDFGPYPNFWSVVYTFFDANNGVQEITAVTTRDKYYRTFSNGTIGDWKPIATATPPQEFDLPLAAGVTASLAKYFKTQDGVVSVHFSLIRSSETLSGATVATLPAGYCPQSGLEAPMAFGAGGNGMAAISTDGAIKIWGTTIPANQLFCAVFSPFVAAM